LVTISPTRPVCIEGRPCSKPAAGVFLVFRRDERVAARVKTLADGTYRVALRPGRYAVSTPGLSRISRLEPRMVRVPRSGSAVVHFTIDSGLQ
jgi:hypothetical protein